MGAPAEEFRRITLTGHYGLHRPTGAAAEMPALQVRKNTFVLRILLSVVQFYCMAMSSERQPLTMNITLNLALA